jgi:hypothetical protein
MAENDRIVNLAKEAEQNRWKLISRLYNSFGIDDQTLDQFKEYLQAEFDEVKAAGMLTEEPSLVEFTNPPIIAGEEMLVMDLRMQIADAAEAVEAIQDFNKFAENFVCSELEDEIDAAIAQAEERLTEWGEKLDMQVGDIFLVEGGDDETRFEFETRLRDEFNAASSAPSSSGSSSSSSSSGSSSSSSSVTTHTHSHNGHSHEHTHA